MRIYEGIGPHRGKCLFGDSDARVLMYEQIGIEPIRGWEQIDREFLRQFDRDYAGLVVFRALDRLSQRGGLPGGKRGGGVVASSSFVPFYGRPLGSGLKCCRPDRFFSVH